CNEYRQRKSALIDASAGFVLVSKAARAAQQVARPADAELEFGLSDEADHGTWFDPQFLGDCWVGSALAQQAEGLLFAPGQGGRLTGFDLERRRCSAQVDSIVNITMTQPNMTHRLRKLVGRGILEHVAGCSRFHRGNDEIQVGMHAE